jgi:uncharacterized protein YxeA
MEIKHPAKPNHLKIPMKNLLVKLLPLLAIVIAAPAFAGTNEYHDRSNRQISYGENQYHQHRSHTVKHRREYVKVKVVTRKNYSPRFSRQEVQHEYRGYRQVRGNRDNYSHR